MQKPLSTDALTIQNLAARYRSGQWSVAGVVEECLRRIEAYADPATWIDLYSRDEVLAQAHAAQARLDAGEKQPLLGVPFAIKDNIDMAGHATTAACPSFSYRPDRSATVVARLLAAGAIAMGKTNLDQFATGVVGTRSPFGTPRNPFDEKYVPGGSSSGSAVAVAAGLVSFSLGTDTAGSGRVPAAFNNIVGLKPTCGRLSTAGVVPACRSLDCVSIFALTCGDAAEVMHVAQGFDFDDPYSRGPGQIPARPRAFPQGFRFGVPNDDQLKFFGNGEAHELYRSAARRMRALGGVQVEVDFSLFRQAGALLYDGPWIAERLAGLKAFVDDHPDALLPVTRTILESSNRFNALDAFAGLHQLRKLYRATARQWEKMDVLLLPTTGTIYTRAHMDSDPIKANAELAWYTTFANLLDLCAVAVPSGFMTNGLPLGVSVIAPAGFDTALLELGDQLHRSAGIALGGPKYHFAPQRHAMPVGEELIKIAVVGAHLSGQPLNHQLTSLQGRLSATLRTAPEYRLFALANTIPPKPGLVRVGADVGASIELEIWELTAEAFGRFVAAIPPPMSICTLRLENGSEVKGFGCEQLAARGAQDISSFGGWRAYLASL